MEKPDLIHQAISLYRPNRRRKSFTSFQFNVIYVSLFSCQQCCLCAKNSDKLRFVVKDSQSVTVSGVSVMVKVTVVLVMVSMELREAGN